MPMLQLQQQCEAIHQRCQHMYVYAHTPTNKGWYIYTNLQLCQLHILTCSLNSMVLLISQYWILAVVWQSCEQVFYREHRRENKH